jgi:hypothetical protein
VGCLTPLTLQEKLHHDQDTIICTQAVGRNVLGR